MRFPSFSTFFHMIWNLSCTIFSSRASLEDENSTNFSSKEHITRLFSFSMSHGLYCAVKEILSDKQLNTTNNHIFHKKIFYFCKNHTLREHILGYLVSTHIHNFCKLGTSIQITLNKVKGSIGDKSRLILDPLVIRSIHSRISNWWLLVKRFTSFSKSPSHSC